VRPLRYFGRDLVAFRTADGVARVLDAHCPHLGAHLGVGGKVLGKQLECPFHGWTYAGDGTCVNIPYSERVNRKAKLRTYPVVVRNGMVMAWRHPDEAEPQWEIPEIPEVGDPEWSEVYRSSYTINTVPQEMAENGVDPAHFRYVHGTLNVPVMTATEEGPLRRAHQPIEMRTPRGEVKGEIEARSFGMGFSVTRFTGICETLELATTTPVDATTSHVRYAFSQPRVNGQDPKGGVAAAIIRDIVKQTNEDIVIWEHKLYRDTPVLCDGDGPIALLRKFYRQFYPD
jgi:phenylpropionate dioxygenase-like ring-hydroxylating dioxygenase large terminal subunit